MIKDFKEIFYKTKFDRIIRSNEINKLNSHLKIANWEIDNLGNGDYFCKSIGLTEEDIKSIRESRCK